MGRRKIEIKAIKDDRNRSVTFLKRKGGLFKKAHELSVLCSVDVAVIIFGHNKKLYEFSSGDINETLGRYQYYGQPHEHKGPADFAGKQSLDDDDEEDLSGVEDIIPPQNHNMVPPPQIQNQPTFQHINHHPSASPPIPNGVFHPRHGTPQPVISRPPSRNNLQRVGGSGLVPQQQRHPATSPPPQNGFSAYMPNPSMYNAQNIPQQAPRPGQYPYPPPMPQHHHHHAQQHPPPPPQAHHPSLPPRHHTPQPHHQSMAQPPPSYLQEHQKRHSMPGPFPPPERQVQSQSRSPPQPQPLQKTQHNHTPPPPKPLPSKSRSIFTPIDDRGSVLAQHFGFGPHSDSPKTDSPLKPDPENADTNSHPAPPQPSAAPVRSTTLPAHPQRAHSLSSIPDVAPISRSNSLQVGAKRPRLKVQIPSENSDAGSATAESSPRESTGNTAATPARGSSDGGHTGVVLPPPSPSATALLSAGAQGPPNPFARPPPPSAVVTSSSQNNTSSTFSSNSHNNNNIDTPISALPSRFVSDTLLPSPSSFYPEWGFGRSGPDSNVLPSPLTFPTPIVTNGPGFSSAINSHSNSQSQSGSGLKEKEKDGVGVGALEEGGMDRKRKSPEGGMSASGMSHAHGPAGVAVGKRVKVE
ncbi:SRF-type transcription factor RlmA [Histoplasma capsulatum G186AR]|uniref:SRF-type transcription factor RlmA n=2 Tax=Ajellomyces capsulatus TaxID=5037 RepID=C0NAQ8_AJECG|nr:SRF-type transcription factor RlmA [Histoplasma capsulatum G186AR]EEH10749.1 SRF-type transcription factor RlmA [Histoplasma capsulatum G186AR]KAG5288634.1 SRF-type transcription factor RlmA [Histoplasma capsulatum]QSS71209.1 SRF-type transcription factor RlmA [Histoplasma capsulatum G186AR]